jgi:light-regulated signal transduction histidine kinase (bacteriophytochrome)
MREGAPDHGVLEVLLARPTELMALVGAEGAAVVSGRSVMTCGRTPPPALVQDIATWVDEKEAFRPFSTASLGAMFPRGREAGDVASGLLTFALPGGSHERLLWFRPEIIQTVTWGGDPTKPVAAGSGEHLHPRHSFALWREEVKLRSHPWTASDLEAADELRRHAVEVDLERRLVSEQRAVQARDELIAVVSHDLRSPLTAILMTAETISRSAPAGDEERARLHVGAERIRRTATHMKALIDDLLDLAVIEANRFALHLQAVESRVLVEEALMAASPLAEAKRITLAVELIDSPRLQADPERILRVLSNLLGNAIRFTPETGTITVRTERRGDELLITVVDTGPGIAADQLPHIFERYWRARPASQVGAGLGLHIAKGIVEAHGGRIWAESSAAGARLSFTLPLGLESKARQQPQGKAATPVRSSPGL